MAKQKITSKQIIEGNKESFKELSPFHRILLIFQLLFSISLLLFCILGITKVMAPAYATPIALILLILLMLTFAINNFKQKKALAIGYLITSIVLVLFIISAVMAGSFF